MSKFIELGLLVCRGPFGLGSPSKGGVGGVQNVVAIVSVASLHIATGGPNNRWAYTAHHRKPVVQKSQMPYMSFDYYPRVWQPVMGSARTQIALVYCFVPQVKLAPEDSHPATKSRSTLTPRLVPCHSNI